MTFRRRPLAFAASSLVALVVACGSSSSSDDSAIAADASTNDATIATDAGGNDGAPIADSGADAGLTKPFDWVGVIGTGQSLSVGATAGTISTTQPFHNLKLVDTGPDPKYPIFPDAGSPVWATTPLVQPIRPHLDGPDGGGYGDGQYPDNTAGESPHPGMANTLTTIWKSRGEPGGEYVSAHTVVGWSGNCLTHIDKEGGYRAYPASLEETRVWKSLATAAGKTYGVGGIVLTHGECDANNPAYGTGLLQFQQDYDTDIKAITGQSNDVVLFISQQSTYGGPASSAIQAWQDGVAHPNQIVVTGPKYQYGYNPGLLHLPGPGYLEMGEKYAEVFDAVVNQHLAWKPLQPNKISRAGAVVTVTFDVPNPPLVWDAHMPLAHQTTNTEWKNGKGFEVKNGTTALTISSATISGSTVVLTLSADPGAAAKVTVGYALTQDGTGTQGGTAMGLVGSLRDSDAFVGWDEETVTANVTNGSAVVTTATANGFLRRATKDIVTSTTTGLAADTVVLSYDSATQLTLTAPWSGATGTAALAMHHDEYNYCVHFTMTEP
jgi:hypothetical protein